MTISVLKSGELDESLSSFGNLKTEVPPAGEKKRLIAPLSGKALIERAKGLFSKEEADELDRHIVDSSEQLND